MPKKRKSQALFTRAIESDTLHLLLTSARFYHRIGAFLQAEHFPSSETKVVLDLARVFYQGAPSSALFSLSVCAQRLARMREDGQITVEEADDIFDQLDTIVCRPPPELEGVMHELATELRRVGHEEVVTRALDLHAKRGDLSEVAEQILSLKKLGEKEAQAVATTWDDDVVVDATDQDKPAARLRTGIETLDEYLGGGLPCASLIYALGATGAGKSIYLSQQGAQALQDGFDTFILTLEVGEKLWGARLRAAATDIPIRAIYSGALTEEDLAQIRSARAGSVAKIVKMRAETTTVDDVYRAFDEANRELAQRYGAHRRYRVLILDYADKLGYPATAKGAYEGQKLVYDALREEAIERDIWLITASQAKRNDRKKKKDTYLTVEDTADSIHKARIADVAFTINVSEDRTHVRIYLDKVRDGEGGFLSDLLETGYECGRITAREYERARPTESSSTAIELPF